MPQDTAADPPPHDLLAAYMASSPTRCHQSTINEQSLAVLQSTKCNNQPQMEGEQTIHII
jgi:hypothetical protein